MLLNTPVCDFGWQAPDFTLPDTDNRLHELESLIGANGLLIAFICNHCPYVKAIIDRSVSDAIALERHGVNTVAIMPNDYHSYPKDSPENMVAFINSHHIPFPYLIDETQQVAKAYEAVCTPDFFGLNAEGKLQYRGRLDDAKMGTADNRQPELLEAMIKIAETGHNFRTPSLLNGMFNKMAVSELTVYPIKSVASMLKQLRNWHTDARKDAETDRADKLSDLVDCFCRRFAWSFTGMVVVYVKKLQITCAVFICSLCIVISSAQVIAAEPLKKALSNTSANAVFMRHALAPGFGDPVQFQIDDCSTQRNLDQSGRRQARFIGKYLRDHEVVFDTILSSQWCRCKQTADLLNMGSWHEFTGLNSFFRVMLTPQIH